MAFIRTVKRENPFVQLDKMFLEDENLQWESKGLLGYILSRPDNWKINQTDLVKRSAGGKVKVESALLDLMANGYVNWYAVRNEDGTIKEWVYDVYERPEFNPNKDECIAEGKRRIEEKKARNKRKNEKKKTPEVGNPEVGNPEVDNPEVDNPEVDNPSYNNIDFNNINFNNKEEEEEKAAPSELFSFLLSKDITHENAMKFETRLLEEKVAGFTYEQVIEAIEWSLVKFSEGKCDEPYIYAVGRLKRVLDGKMNEIANKPKSPARKGKITRAEKLPDWFVKETDSNSVLVMETESEDHKRKKQDIEDMLKRLRS